jgi:hypothetical protein
LVLKNFRRSWYISTEDQYKTPELNWSNSDDRFLSRIIGSRNSVIAHIPNRSKQAANGKYEYWTSSISVGTIHAHGFFCGW